MKSSDFSGRYIYIYVNKYFAGVCVNIIKFMIYSMAFKCDFCLFVRVISGRCLGPAKAISFKLNVCICIRWKSREWF